MKICKIINTSEQEYANKTVVKTEILYGLNSTNYIIKDTSFFKNITCINGSCSLDIKNSEHKETVVLNKPNISAQINSGANININNYLPDTKIGIVYFKETQQ